MRTATASLFVLCGSALVAGRALAHFGPAEAPDFGAPECIIVVDTRESSELMLSYALGYDDVEPEFEKIPLPDTKTHSFFAFRGAVVPDLPRYTYTPFGGEAAGLLPLWIDADDLERADAANTPSIAPDFHATDIGEDTLLARADLAGHWLDVSSTRVPITIEQASKGLTWKLNGVAPGVYQIAGYIFSPPFNA